ncbi:hypothetical protein Plhal304r1_c010g0039151 [Plasmopara halstedii]
MPRNRIPQPSDLFKKHISDTPSVVRRPLLNEQLQDVKNPLQKAKWMKIISYKVPEDHLVYRPMTKWSGYPEVPMVLPENGLGLER